MSTITVSAKTPTPLERFNAWQHALTTYFNIVQSGQNIPDAELMRVPSVSELKELARKARLAKVDWATVSSDVQPVIRHVLDRLIQLSATILSDQGYSNAQRIQAHSDIIKAIAKHGLTTSSYLASIDNKDDKNFARETLMKGAALTVRFELGQIYSKISLEPEDFPVVMDPAAGENKRLEALLRNVPQAMKLLGILEQGGYTEFNEPGLVDAIMPVVIRQYYLSDRSEPGMEIN